MADQVSVDPEVLRAAAGRLDVLFTDSGTALRETDQAIADSHGAWKGDAVAAFARFTSYLDDRRTLLERNLGEMAESLKTAADTLAAQDQVTADVLVGQSPQVPTSLNLQPDPQR
ncbi:WXG100 family type VII secretion target [Nocardia cyriacigeorgica]|uniref:WXG100 family type VII secretion target n=1 Tax=Nocardia cyriacigeorgica TaxID=135487 RepID=UPI0018931016|nr:WXG100 family type VII secretion target [Nocardia cyriacigeorgica]MBF6438114.1 WXG100 family type VII secretion target [Nocardia cyriacigeorgica]MBF6453649.1 WXG100 family type VII secretion target [Nocardia cyriacigeorgica]MBF6478916.1 WXG100 family type VII secretion target [Nocardia cyriacigeorgica]MBF6550817.1 WXG100 family type VII secretion target [Nocardia cyriacigeorgica]